MASICMIDLKIDAEVNDVILFFFFAICSAGMWRQKCISKGHS